MIERSDVTRIDLPAGRLTKSSDLPYRRIYQTRQITANRYIAPNDLLHPPIHQSDQVYQADRPIKPTYCTEPTSSPTRSIYTTDRASRPTLRRLRQHVDRERHDHPYHGGAPFPQHRRSALAQPGDYLERQLSGRHLKRSTTQTNAIRSF